MLSQTAALDEETINKWGYRKEMAINHKDVGAYLFDYGKDNKVKVASIEVTETGFEVSTIDAAISQLNETSQALYYHLRYGKEN
jgi:hypothetical protein